MARRGKTEKVSVTLPRELAGEIRSIASPGDVSSFFTEALRYYLAYRRQKTALEKGFGAWEDGNHPDLVAPQDTITYVRRLRDVDENRLQRWGDAIAE